MTAPTASIRGTLAFPSLNMTSISAQQHPTHHPP
jgi:hypothetical protein